MLAFAGKFSDINMRRQTMMNVKRFIYVMAAIVGAAILSNSTVAAQTPAPIQVIVDDTGFNPAEIIAVAGQSIQWVNQSSGNHSVTADNGLFDSGALAPAAGYGIALAVPGVHTYRSTFDTSFVGEVHIALDGLPGLPTDLASSSIPAITFPLETSADVSFHPRDGVMTSRTRILVGFVDTATVAEANAALQGAGVVITGGLPNSHILLVEAPDTPDLSALDAAVDALLLYPAIEFAAMSQQMDTTELPRPAESITYTPPHSWTWEVTQGPNGEPLGTPGNWNLESMRMPQAWNFREAVVRSGSVNTTRTGVVDSGFETHDEFYTTRSVEILCKPTPNGQKCTDNLVGSHGQLTSSLIGAAYDNDSIEPGRSAGVSGVNPVARMAAINYSYVGGNTKGFADILEIIDLAVTNVADMKVVNISLRQGLPQTLNTAIAPAAPNDVWWQNEGYLPICGPGDNDDNSGGSNDFCTANNDDDWLKKKANNGKAARNIAEFASSKNIVIVQSAGNESGQTASSFCLGTAPNSAGCTWEKIEAKNVAEFAWASANWADPSIPNPIIIAEAIDENFKRAVYSNIGGDLSAPGNNLVHAGLGNVYNIKAWGGTSSAAPHISGLVGYMFAIDPSLTVTEVKNYLMAWARGDTTDGAASRIDGFASILAQPNAASVLVDVNDTSTDGNRRVILGKTDINNSGGVVIGPDVQSSNEIDPTTGTWYQAQPDQVVDMRDFRRYRDAWLASCFWGVILPNDCTDIADTNAIFLDGANDHPKKDLNFDRCVQQGSGDVNCPTLENVFSRFDFNGDGFISLKAFAEVPLKPDGSPAASLIEATLMTDLEVLQSQWDSDPLKTEGYLASDLPGLMKSGDLLIYADDLFGQGSGDVDVFVELTGTTKTLPSRTISAGGHIVYTVPSGVPMKVKASTVINGQTVLTQPIGGPLGPGQDARVDLCARSLTLNTDTLTLQANGTDQANLSANVVRCSLDPTGLLDVTFTLQPVGGSNGSLAFSTVGTTANVSADNIFTAGTAVDTYDITATATLGSSVLTDTIQISTVDPLKIAYRFKQDTFTFTEHGTSRWPSLPSGAPNQFVFSCADPSIGGTVLDSSGTPVQGATVEVLGFAGKTAITDAVGWYAIADIGWTTNISHIPVTVRASYGTSTVIDKNVDIYCSTFFTIDFGGTVPASNATIQGNVEDALKKQAVPGVFVGTSYGDGTLTDGAGNYSFSNAPLGPLDADTNWQVKVLAPNFPPEAQTVTVSKDITSTQDFSLSLGDCDGVVVQQFSSSDQTATIGTLGNTLFRDADEIYFEVYREGSLVEKWGYNWIPPNTRPPGFTTIPAGLRGWSECVDSFDFDAFPPSSGGYSPPHITISREGILEQVGNTIELDESVTSSEFKGDYSWVAHKSTVPSTSPNKTQDFAGQSATHVVPGSETQYTDYVLPPGVTVTNSPAGLQIDGLREIAELEYPYESSWTYSKAVWGGVDLGTPTFIAINPGGVPFGLGAMQANTNQAELMFVPRGDGTALQYAADTSQPLTFKPDGLGGFQKYEYCEVINENYVSDYEYFSNFNTIFGAEKYWNRNQTFDGISLYDAIGSWFHEYPMPVGPGTFDRRYSFVAIPYTNITEIQQLDAAQLFDPPDCSDTDVVQPDFTFTPAAPEEGYVVFFTDASLSQGNSMAGWDWDFGDGSAHSTAQNPTHRYKDNGVYPVTLVATDVAGSSGTVTINVTVNNLPPEGQLSGAVIVEGQSADINVLLADPGENDQAALAFTVTSTTSGFPGISDTRAAGIHAFSIAGLAAGTYPMALTVTDKDGGVGTATAAIDVLPSGSTPPSPPPPPPPTATCDPTVSLDGEEQLLLDIINVYRVQAGLAPVQGSPGLTLSSDVHALDMVTNNFFAHIGSDNSTPSDRAVAVGYPSTNVGENLAFGLTPPNQVLFGWKSSPPHNANMLNPAWNALGIARLADSNSDYYWGAVFGDVLDCPLGAKVMPTTAPTNMLASASPGATTQVSSMVLAYGDASDVDESPWIPASERTFITGSNIGSRTIAPQQAALQFPPIPAFTVSNASPDVGVSITFTNLSKDSAGQPIHAALDLGVGSGTVALNPGTSFQYTYANAGTYAVTLTATDASSNTLTVSWDIDVAAPPAPPQLPGDFNLTLSPSSQLMAPGTASTFLVSLSSINGFNTPVDLTIGSLPSGITASFAPTQVTPSGTSVLTVTASSSATTGAAGFTVTAQGGGITHTAGGAIDVQFGLVPVCFGSVQGTVTDIATGLPFVGGDILRHNGSSFQSVATTDGAGHYVVTNLPLGLNNTPRSHTFRSFPSDPDYWFLQLQAVAECGLVTTLDFQHTEIGYASMSGYVYEGIPDPNDLTPTRTVTPSNTPIDMADVRLSSFTRDFTDVTGFYSITDILPGSNNTTKNSGNVVVSKTGYWSNTASPVQIQPGVHINSDYVIVPKCTGDISGTVTYSDTGLPADLVQVVLKLGSAKDFAFTDANGDFSFPSKSLGYNNSSAAYDLNVQNIFGYDDLQANADLILCGDSVAVNMPLQAVVLNYAHVTGKIVDRETGLAMPNVPVSFSGGGSFVQGTTDANGDYALNDILLGFDGTLTSVFGTVGAGPTGYWGQNFAITLNSNATTTKDFDLLKQRYGYLSGTIRDAATQQPIVGVQTGAFFIPNPTDAQGQYLSDPLSLNYDNQPAVYGFWANVPGYWKKLVQGTVSADQTTIADVDLIPVCTGATITGSVIDASNQQPIQSAFIQLFSSSGGKSTSTDVNGNFILTDVTVGTDNTPLQVSVRASKSGFLTQTKSVTVFCGASIIVDFGQASTALGTIQGTVTDIATSLPIPSTFIGTEYGSTTTTNSLGQYTLSNAPLGANDTDRNWQITAAPSGFSSITKTATASASGPTTLDFQFGGQTNAPPVLALIGDQTLDEGATPSVSISATDPDGDPITLSATGLPSFATFTDNGGGQGTLDLAPGYADSGTYNGVQITASDGSLPDSETFAIIVNDVNRPPVLALIDDQTLGEGSTPSVSISATDPDGDLITLSATGLPSFATFTDNGGGLGTLDLAPGFTDSGTYNGVQITASDGSLPDSETFAIIVNNVNRPPVLALIGDQALDEGTTPSISISSTDPDGDPLTLSAVGLPSFATFTDNGGGLGTLDLVPGYADSGTYNGVQITASDGSLPDSETFAIIVTDVNRPPVLALIGDQTVDEGATLSVGVSATDPDGDPLTLSAVSLPGFGTLHDNGGGNGDLVLSPISGDAGNYLNIDIVASDGSLSHIRTISITVVAAPANKPPVADAGGPYAGNEGTAVALDANASFDSDGSIVLYEWELDNDSLFDDATGPTASATFPDNGSYTVAVLVTDNAGDSDSDATAVRVQNVAPTVDAGPDRSVALGQPLDLDVSFTDPGQLDAPWTVDVDWGDGTTDSTSVTSQSSPVQFSHTYAASGGYSVQACVTDKDLGTGCYNLGASVVVITAGSPQSLKQQAIDSLLPHLYVDPEGAMEIKVLDVESATIDFAGREYFTATHDVEGNRGATDVVIGSPTYTPSGNVDPDSSEDSTWTFMDGSTVVDTRSVWLHSQDASSWQIPLSGTGSPTTATIYMNIYHWSGENSYLVTAGGATQTIRKSSRYNSLYEIKVSFTDDIVVKIESLGDLQWSAFTFAGLVLDPGNQLNTPVLTDPRIADAIAFIENSLNAKYWVDPYHVVAGDVFDLEEYAVRELQAWLEDSGGASEDAKSWIGMAVDDLVQADRTLADTLLQEAKAAAASNPDPPQSTMELLADAEDYLAAADRDASLGLHAEAIHGYFNAWFAAKAAMTDK